MKKKLYVLSSLLLLAFSAINAQNLPNCNAAFSFQVNVNTVSFYSIRPDSLSTYHYWYFGDATPPATTINPVHTYASPGVYTVKHIRTIAQNGAVLCRDSAVATITIAATNICGLNASFNTIVSPNNSLQWYFQNTTLGLLPTDSVRWTFGDGSPADTSRTTTHTYAAAGTYHVCLRVKRLVNSSTTPCVSEVCQTIVVQQQPSCNIQASFIAHQDSTQPSRWLFASTSINASATDSIRWTFGDGSPAVFNIPTTAHVYANPGTYQVCLWVKRNTPGSTGPCIRETCQTVVVQAANTCNLQAYFTATPTAAQPNVFSFANATLNLLPTDSVRWTFGDGTAAVYNTNNVTHTYTAPGTYRVCIWVKRTVSATATPCVREYCMNVTVVQSTPACNLQGNFIFNRDSANFRRYYFQNTTVNLLPTDSVRWTFGDGSAPALTVNADHTFPGPGYYNVCLRVKRLLPGVTTPCVSETCRTIYISDAQCNITPAFRYNRDSANANFIHFINTSINPSPTDTVRWTFGDGTFANTFHANHTYAAAGVYNVCLRVARPATTATSARCVREYCMPVYVGTNGGTTTNACRLQLYPNPVHSVLNVPVYLAQAQLITVRIYNSQNVLVMQFTQTGIAGSNTVSMNVANLTAGYYRAVLTHGNDICSGTFMKY